MEFSVKKATIFKNEKDGRSWTTMSISQRNKEGQYEFFQEQCRFHNCPDIVGKISEVSGFISYSQKDGKMYRTFYIQNYKQEPF